MADLTSSDVTVTVETERRGGPGVRANTVKIKFGDGAKTYPSGGVPMPSKENFGLVHSFDELVISDADDASGWVPKWDHENQKIRLYEIDMSQTGDTQLVEADSGSDAPAQQVLYGITYGF